MEINFDHVQYDPKPIGSGGYGTVYKGTCNGQIVALKVLKSEKLASLESKAKKKLKKQFREEYERMGLVSSYNLLIVYS